MSTDQNIHDQLEQLHERIDQLEAQQQAQQSFDPREWLDSLPKWSRRRVIQAALSAVGIAAATQPALAQTTKEEIACHWLGHQDAGGYDLLNIGNIEGDPDETTEITSVDKVAFEDGTEQTTAASGGALSDLGTDTDGGDDYGFPNAADNLDLQSDGEIRNAEKITTDQATINDLSAVLKKTSLQSISASTDTTVDWDSQDVDSNQYTYASAADTIDVLAAGDYHVDFAVEWRNVSDQDAVFLKIYVNGSEKRRIGQNLSGTGEQVQYAGTTLKDLTVNDTLRFDVRSSAAQDLSGDGISNYATITRSG